MIVTEIKEIKIDGSCKTNPIFLSWIGTNSGRDQWLFHTVQTYGIDTQSTGDFLPYIQDLSTARGQSIELSKIAVPRIILGTTADREDVDGISSILYSPNVEMLLNPETWEIDGPKWLRVRPVAGSFKIYNTDETRPTIEFTIELVEIYNQTR